MAKKYYKKPDNSWFYECQDGETLLSPNPEKGECVEITKAQYDGREQLINVQKFLRDTDYVVIKIAEAETEEEKAALRIEYAEVLSQRRGARAIINELEGGLK